MAQIHFCRGGNKRYIWRCKTVNQDITVSLYTPSEVLSPQKFLVGVIGKGAAFASGRLGPVSASSMSC